MKAYVDRAGPIILAHRGGGGEAPESSLAAYRHAVELGYDYLELDVRLAPDGKLYIQHGQHPADPPLTLEQLFVTFPKKYFAVDLKHEAALQPLAKLITEHKMAEQICIGCSFDGRTARAAALIEKLSGKRPSTALVSVQASAALLLHLPSLSRQKQRLQASFIHVHKSLISHRAIDFAHRHDLKLIAWTVNDKATMRTFLAWGIDGFMTDFPSVASELRD